MSKNDDLMAKLKQTTAQGNAGVEQAETATEQKERRKKREADAAEVGRGRSVSTFRYPEDEKLIHHLTAEMAAKGIKVNDSLLIRAGLRALDQLPLAAAIELVNKAGEIDRRKR